MNRYGFRLANYSACKLHPMIMDFSWSEEQQQAYAQARAFAERELRYTPSGADAAVWRERWDKCARFGLQGLNIPARYGGLASDTLSALHVLEGIGRGCDDNGLLMGLGAQLWSVNPPLLAFGSEEQKQQWLPLLARGSAVGAFALTEPESGSDVFHLHTHARAESGGFRLSGVKTFITNAPRADLFLLFASSAAGGGYFGLTAFLLPRTLEGLEIGPPMQKMGLETSPMSEVRLDEVWVPAQAVLGETGGGGAVLRYTLEWERGCLLAPALGTIERLLESTAVYTRERKQFGRPVFEFEAVARQLAEMRLRLELARLLVYEFAWHKDQHLPAAVQASMVKLYLSESLRRASELAVHLHGASGYMRELEFERNWRDAMASSIYSGTTEMQHNLIAESLLRAPVARGGEAGR
ncbi:MAG: acyl-CoA dehydrogenase family protein [Terriglobales bacterium]